MKEFVKAVAIRAAQTFCEAAVAMITVNGASIGITDVDWVNVISVSALAALLSVMKSVYAGVPEVQLPPKE